MSLTAHVVAMKSREILFLSKVIRDKNERVIDFGYSEAGGTKYDLEKAIFQFIKDHFFDDVRIMHDFELHEMDLTGFYRVNGEYGLPARVPRQKMWDDSE